MRPVIWMFLRESSRLVVRAMTCVAMVEKMRCQHVSITAGAYHALSARYVRFIPASKRGVGGVSQYVRYSVREDRGQLCDVGQRGEGKGRGAGAAIKTGSGGLNILKPAVSRSHLLNRIVELEKKIQLLHAMHPPHTPLVSKREAGHGAIRTRDVRDVEGGMERGPGRSRLLRDGERRAGHADGSRERIRRSTSRRDTPTTKKNGTSGSQVLTE